MDYEEEKKLFSDFDDAVRWLVNIYPTLDTKPDYQHLKTVNAEIESIKEKYHARLIAIIKDYQGQTEKPFNTEQIKNLAAFLELEKKQKKAIRKLPPPPSKNRLKLSQKFFDDHREKLKKLKEKNAILNTLPDIEAGEMINFNTGTDKKLLLHLRDIVEIFKQLTLDADIFKINKIISDNCLMNNMPITRQQIKDVRHNSKNIAAITERVKKLLQ